MWRGLAVCRRLRLSADRRIVSGTTSVGLLACEDAAAMPTSFTVAVPTHDRRELVTLAVASALAQTRPPLEVIVLADGCTDGTAAALHALGDERVRVVELEKGPGYAYAHRNLALREARGDVVSWLGDDDLYFRDHLAVIGELWDAGGVDLVQGCAVQIDEADGMWLMGCDWGVERFRGETLGGRNRTPSTAISHRPDLALEVGGWNGDCPRGGDLDLWVRMLTAGARTCMSGTPTILNLLGSNRAQTPEQRRRQNGRHAEALGDPRAAAHLRSHAVRAGQRQLSDLEQVLADRTVQVDELVERLGEVVERLGEVERETLRQREALTAIYDGGWWRLRNRLLRLPLAGRVIRRGA
jgi:Glycosyl transferase family 2